MALSLKTHHHQIASNQCGASCPPGLAMNINGTFVGHVRPLQCDAGNFSIFRQEFVDKFHARFEFGLTWCLKDVCSRQLEERNVVGFPFLKNSVKLPKRIEVSRQITHLSIIREHCQFIILVHRNDRFDILILDQLENIR